MEVMDTNLIVPGVVCWVHCGGDFLPVKVVTRNQRKKTAFVTFCDKDKNDDKKILVKFSDMVSMV